LDCSSTEILWDKPLALVPIVHPQRWGPDDPELTEIYIPESGVHPLLASILAPRVPKIHLETALSCLRYLQSGGHSVKSRKSLKPFLGSRYFTRLKMRPSLSRFRKRRHHHSSGRCLLDEQDFHSMWWGDHPERPYDSIRRKIGVRVPLRFFSYRSEYASNYDLWCTSVTLHLSFQDSHIFGMFLAVSRFPEFWKPRFVTKSVQNVWLK